MKKVAVVLILVLLCCTLFGCGLFNKSKEVIIKIEGDEEVHLQINETVQLNATIKGLSGTPIWESNDTSIADVNANGLVTAKSEGAAIISVIVGKRFDAVLVIVSEETITVSLSVAKTSLLVGESVALNATVTPEKYQSDVEYVIDEGNSAISISGNTLTAKAEGSARIYAQVNGKKSQSVTITVVDNSIKINSITLSANKTELKIGEKATLTAIVNPNKYSDLVEYVISSNSQIASISGNVLSAIAEGTVSVCAKIGSYISNTVTLKIDGSTIVADSVKVRAQKYYITAGQSTTLSAIVTPTSVEDLVTYEIVENSNLAQISGNTLKTTSEGQIKVVASVGGTVSDPITIFIVKSGNTPSTVTATASQKQVAVGNYASLSYSVYPSSSAKDIEYLVIEGENNVEIVSDKVYVLKKQPAKIVGRIGSKISDVIEINPNTVSSDPYTSVSSSSFHNEYSYTKATCYQDAEYRTKHYLMSGDISAQNEKPTIATDRPYVLQNNKKVYYRNSTTLFCDDKNTYIVFDVNGNVVNIIYKSGAYVTLEEVAAYVLAFGDVPDNYDATKSKSPTTGWKQFLRYNHTDFSGNTTKYPYEPVLPNISGVNNGSYSYMEIDIGTTGTTCDPNRTPTIYNNGNKIIRGAARIVYSQKVNGKLFTDINERYVFYTYNHYNDFQEYLNYENGWGEMFGNISNGGKLDSGSNPSQYVSVIMFSFLDRKFA